MTGRRKRNARRTKKKAAAGKDRFEDLPDHVLELVLSFLPSQEVVQTCVLAKRWRHIWKSVPSLRISNDEFETDEEINSFGNKLIELRDPTAPLHECELVPYDDIDSWLQYAFSCQVKVLKVETPSYCNHALMYSDSFVSGHLTRLELYHIEFEPEHTMDFSSCQALEVLDMDDCLVNLGEIVFAQALQHLRLRDIVFYPENIRARISAPGLVTCKLDDCRGLTPLFVSLPSVITAFIRIQAESEEDCEPSVTEYCEGFCCQDDYPVLLQGLSGATNLELICDSDTMIFRKDVRWRHTFGKLKTVLLSDWCVADNFTGLIYFLQHSPVLERLTLHFRPSPEKSFCKMLDCYTQREHFLVSKHLKVVEIKSFKVKWIHIHQIVKILGTIGVNRETINIDEDFSFYNTFSFEQKKYEQKSILTP